MSMVRTSRAVGMLEAGKTQRHIAERPNISQSVIVFFKEPIFSAGNCQSKPKSGRQRCTTVHGDCYLAHAAKRHRFQSAVKLNAEFQRALG